MEKFSGGYKTMAQGVNDMVAGHVQLTDTSLADAVLRNGITFNAESVVVLSAPAASAPPALKPNHPNQSRAAPITESTTLCGGMGVRPKPCRWPSTSAAVWRCEVAMNSAMLVAGCWPSPKMPGSSATAVSGYFSDE